MIQSKLDINVILSSIANFSTYITPLLRNNKTLEKPLNPFSLMSMQANSLESLKMSQSDSSLAFIRRHYILHKLETSESRDAKKEE